jgi:hypothetical protein
MRAGGNRLISYRQCGPTTSGLRDQSAAFPRYFLAMQKLVLSTLAVVLVVALTADAAVRSN